MKIIIVSVVLIFIAVGILIYLLTSILIDTLFPSISDFEGIKKTSLITYGRYGYYVIIFEGDPNNQVKKIICYKEKEVGEEIKKR